MRQRRSAQLAGWALALPLCSALAVSTPASTIKRVRFLFSDTGGGHRASAVALKDALEARFQVECDMVDMFVESACMPFCFYHQIYKVLAENPWAWEAVYDFGDSPFGLWFNELCTDAVCFDAFRKLLDSSTRPDLVVSVHPLMQTTPLKALADLDGGSRTTPFATVVTDLGAASRQWFDQRVDRCFVPSEALRRIAQGRGLSEEQVVQHGLPIRRGFWAGGPDRAAKERIRDSLGLARDLPTVLVVGGGDGMGGLTATAKAIGEGLGGISSSTSSTSVEAASPGGAAPPGAQMVVVCGRNSEAAETLKATRWPPNVRVSVQGFVSNMDELMAAADLLVTKAGPGTIAEASSMGLPCVLNSYLPGQEAGNLDFVRDGGFGEFRAEPQAVAELVVERLGDEEGLARMVSAAREAGRPEATMSIAADLARLVGAAPKSDSIGDKEI
jgi:1,2-diacylglycerol 3-beta-galactosyltransferase